MPRSPRTPTRPRKVFSADLPCTPAGPRGNQYGSSSVSDKSPTTPRAPSSYGRGENLSGSIGYSNDPDSGSADGLGSLADELAEAWDEDDEGEIDGVLAMHNVGADGGLRVETNGFPSKENHHDPGAVVPSKPQTPGTASNTIQEPPMTTSRSANLRQRPEYDNPNSEDDSDQEAMDHNSRSFDSCMAAIENLARGVTDSGGDKPDCVIKRVADALKDLRTQSGVEDGATRYVGPEPFAKADC